MLAGAPPFTGPNAQSILARHAVDPVPPLRTVRSTVPDAVEAAVERALAKVPADRYATAGEFAAALVAEGAASKPSRRANRLRKGLALGTTVAMVLAGIGALALRRTASSTVLPSASSIAVIPFRSADDDTALARLGRDLAITVSASLDGVGGIATTDRLRVAHETAERRMKSPEDAAALARRLNARSVLVGTMVRDGNGVRLDLGLYDAQDLEPLARGITVTDHRDSLTALTDSVVWAVLRQVWQRGKLPTPSLAAVTSKSLPALRAFLDGEQYVENDEWDAAVLAYRSAFTADSTFWLAYFRYSFAQYWGGHQTEPEISDAFYRHRHVLPERDRLLIEGWSISDSLSLELERYREITRRFPDYWPAWFLLGDRLFHVGILLGYDWKDVQSALGRAVALNRHLTPAWLHLFGNTVGKDTVESARVLAHGSDVPLLRGPVLRLLHDVARSGGVISEGTSALADSVAKARAANSDEFPAITWILLGRGFPAAQIQFNSRLHRMETEPRKVASQLRGSAWSWAARGAWDSGLVAIHEAVRAEPRAPSERGPTALTEYGMAVLGAWLGTLPASEAVVRRAPAQALVGGLEEGPGKRESLSELAWLDGVLGFTQQDRTAVERARERARRSGYPYSGIIDTSLAAFSKALSGNRAGAGRDLAALEWRCVNRWDCGGTVTPNIAIHRLVAARWLLEDGDTAQAGRLLTWHEAESSLLESSFTYAVSPLAYLLLARIEDAQGDTRSASEHYQQFLRRYDMPMPAQRHLVDEARAALSRLSGRGDPAAIR
jgi:TolB-like protein